MDSYTYMSDRALLATINANGDQHYSMNLSPGDLARLLWALRVAHDADAHERGVIGTDGRELFSDNDGSISDWAGSFASGIAETLGVDWI